MRDSADDPARLVARLTAVVAIAAGVIHFSAAGDHRSLPVLLVGFLVVGALQVALGGVLMTRRPSRWVVLGGIALTLGAIGAWLLSRTEGLPFVEDGHLEPVGVKDGVTVLFELAALPGLLLLLSRDLSQVSLPPRLRTQSLSVMAIATFALMVPALALEGGRVHSHDEAVELGIHDEDGHEIANAGEHRRGESHVRGARAHRKAAHRRAAKHDDGDGGHGAGGADGHGHTQLASAGPGHGGGSHEGGGPRHEGRDHTKRRHDQSDHRRNKPHRNHPPRRPGGGDDHGGHHPKPKPPESEEPPADAEPAICLRVTQTELCLPGDG